MITLMARVYNLKYLKNSNSLFTINYEQKQFYVYSGIADVFIGDRKLMRYAENDATNTIFNQWGILLDSSRYEVDTNKANIGIPFFPSTPFVLPVDK